MACQKVEAPTGTGDSPGLRVIPPGPEYSKAPRAKDLPMTLFRDSLNVPDERLVVHAHLDWVLVASEEGPEVTFVDEAAHLVF